MRKELEGFSPEELEEAAREARQARADYWDKRLADPNDNLEDVDFSKPVKVRMAKHPGARATVGLRLAAGELALIERAARKRGVSFSEFVRDAALVLASESLSPDRAEQARLMAQLRVQLHDFEAALDRALRAS